ncbi:hypothetical protein N8814_01305 [Acidimicrobiia bacterium]|nr:hypothetical protein [Acidimicrobiia bacterium]
MDIKKIFKEINQTTKVDEEYIELLDSNFDDNPDVFLLEMKKFCE